MQALATKLVEKPGIMPDFFLTERVHLRGIKAFANGLFLRCLTCSRKVEANDAKCSHCGSEQDEPDVEILANCEFADGVGGRLFAKVDFRLILELSRLTPEALLDGIDADKSLVQKLANVAQLQVPIRNEPQTLLPLPLSLYRPSSGVDAGRPEPRTPNPDGQGGFGNPVRENRIEKVKFLSGNGLMVRHRKP